MIMDNSYAADLIQGTSGLRKLRFALSDKGKSGGARVLYVDFVSSERTILMDIFCRNKKPELKT